MAVPSDSKYLAVVHERAREVAQANRFGEVESEQWALAVEECAANSIEHAYGGRPDGEVDITLALEGDYLCAEIADQGRSFEAPAAAAADVQELARKGARGGLGLTLVQRIADSVVWEHEGRQNVCRLLKRLPQNPRTDKEKLAAAEFQLRTLVELGREFSTNLDPERVASIALASLMGHLTILRAAFLTATPGGRVRVLASRGVKNVESIAGLPWASLAGEGDCTEAPEAPLKALRLDFIFRFTSGEEKGVLLFSPRLSGSGFGEGERDLIHAVGRQALASLTGARAQELRIEKARADSELQVAREIQKSLLPTLLPPIPGFEVAASSEACFSVGGDLFDVIALDDARFAIVLADVSGKGTPASLIMAFAHAAFRSLANSLPPVALMARVSELIRNANKSHRYATCFYAELDPSTRRMIYVNAGHQPPAIVRGEQTIDLKVGGSVLGLLPGTTFEQGEVTLEPGDVLALYSDGLSEALSPTEDEFGPEGVLACVRALRGKPASEILRLLDQTLFEFAAGRPFADDRTALILKAL